MPKRSKDICIYKGSIRDKSPPVSAVIDNYREVQVLLRIKVSLGFGDVNSMQAFNMYFSDSLLCCVDQRFIV